MAIGTEEPRTRRALLTAVGGAIAALVAQAMGRPIDVRAEGETIHVGDNLFTSETATWLKNTTTENDVLRAETTRSGRGMFGVSASGAGVHGKSASDTGVLGESGGFGRGVSGSSPSGIGVRGTTTSGFGLKGEAVTGVAIQGQIDDPSSTYSSVVGHTAGRGPGIRGNSLLGRGGLFKGKTAQIRLEPSDAATHPASGAAGDLFVDDRHRLWFCRGETTWVRLA